MILRISILIFQKLLSISILKIRLICIFGSFWPYLVYSVYYILSIMEILISIFQTGRSFHPPPAYVEVSVWMHMSICKWVRMLLPLKFYCYHGLNCVQQCILGLWCGLSTLFCLEVLWRAWIEWFIAYFIIDPLIISQDDEMFHITIDSWFCPFWKSSNKNYQT